MSQISDDIELLLVEDNPSDIFLIRHMLESSNLRIKKIHETDRLADACRLLSDEKIHVTLLDLSLPDSFGIDSFFGIRHAAQKIPVIILTGLADTDAALNAIKEGANDYLVKNEINGAILAKAIMYSLERQKQEEKLKESEQKYRIMFQRNPFSSMIIDLATLKILEVNDAAIEKYGYSREEFLSMTIANMRPSDDVEDLMRRIAESPTPKKDPTLSRHKKKNGELMFMEVTYYPINYFGKTAMQAQMNDVSDKVKLEKELERQRKLRQRQITAAVLEAQEKEREAIGQELHDNVNQILTSVKMYLGMGIKKPEKNDEYFRKSIELTSLAIEENRKLSKSLILPQLKGEGLIKSLEELVAEIILSTELQISLKHRDFDESVFNEQEKLSVYRIVQEQMNNVIKHAKAQKVTIDLYKDRDKLILSIQDDGKGFDVNAAFGGVGITNIRSRTEALNGSLTINSAPGQGTGMLIRFDQADSE